ncbi:MAG: methionyl-tRNA formyltransferase, partial [Rhodobacteraceae bacterium]
GFTIACGSGALDVLEAQRPGKRPMETAEILRGLTLPARLD